MRTSLRIGAIVGTILLVSGDLRGSAPLRLQVSPAFSRAPGRVTVRVTVESATENRLLQVVTASANYYRSSEVQIDGNDGSTFKVFEFNNLPTGQYQITGVLLGTNGPRGTASGVARVEPSAGG
jgi:uncharacterized protein (DUF58 family)